MTTSNPIPAFGQEPPVSVIVGCFNQAAYIETALRSVAQQTYSNFECVVIDDASADPSQERIREVLADLADGRFSFVGRTTNGGQMTSMMQGFDATGSPFVAFLDGDDCWNPDFLERHVNAHLSRSGMAAVSASDEVVVDETGRVLAGGLSMFREGDPRRKMSGRKCIKAVEGGDDPLVFIGRQATGWLWSTTSGMMFRRKSIQAMRPLDTAQIRLCADAYLAPAAHMLGGTVRLERVLGSYRIHQSNGWASNGILGDDCRTGAAPPETDAQIRRAIAERWCAIAPDIDPIIPKRVMSRTLVNHIGWAAALDLAESNPDARKLLSDWMKPSRRRMLRFASVLPRALRPRVLR